MHSCKRCLELNLVSDLTIDDPPFNVCDNHPLCFFSNCLCCPQSGGNYCQNHSIVRCTGITKKGKPCKGHARSRMMPYCSDHSYLANNMFKKDESILSERATSQTETSLVSKRCPFIKKKGGQCKAYCTSGSSCCTDHQGVVTLKPKGVIRVQDVTPNVLLNQTRGKPPKGECSDMNLKQRSQICNDDVSANGNKKGITVNDNVDESMSISSGSSCWEESTNQAVADNADELEFLEEEDENLKHLRDVFEVDDEDLDELGSLTSTAANLHHDDIRNFSNNIKHSNGSKAHYQTPEEWTWDWSLEQHWEACKALMDRLYHLLSDKVMPLVKSAILLARKDLQHAKILTKAKAYENKSIIGGTMVGCITRLESIRKTRPSAVVVEEASEVLEPLLFACLSDSTLKLEMIITDNFNHQ